MYESMIQPVATIIIVLSICVLMWLLFKRLENKIIKHINDLTGAVQSLLSNGGSNAQILTKISSIENNLPTVSAISSNIKAIIEKNHSNSSIKTEGMLNSLSSLKQDINEMKSVISGIKTMKDSNIELTSRFEEVYLNFDSLCEKLNSQFRGIEGDKKRMEEDYQRKLSSKIELITLELRKDYETKLSGCNDLKTQLSDKSTKIKELENALISAEIKGKEKALSEMKEEMTKTYTEIGKLKEQLNSREDHYQAKMGEECKKVEDRVRGEFLNHINKLQTSLEQKTKEAASYSAQFTKAQNDVQKAEISLKADEEKRKELEGKLNSEQQVANRFKTENESLRTDNEALKKLSHDQNEKNSLLIAEKEKATQIIHKKESLITALQSEIYPEEIVNDPAFAALKSHIEEWAKSKPNSISVIRANLILLANRDNLNADSWKLALKNISVGISSTMRQANCNAQDVIPELVLWSNYLVEKYSDEKYPFSLKIPALGDNYDTSWMRSKNKNLMKVKEVLSWAVFHNEFGIQHNAEVL